MTIISTLTPRKIIDIGGPTGPEVVDLVVPALVRDFIRLRVQNECYSMVYRGQFNPRRKGFSGTVIIDGIILRF